MDDTISYGTDKNEKWFDVSVKHVRNGQLIRTEKWQFVKSGKDFWRYHTSRMPPKYNPISSSNAIFIFTMDRLGWPYYTVNKHGWEYVY